MKRKIIATKKIKASKNPSVQLIGQWRYFDSGDWEIEETQVSGKNLLDALYKLMKQMDLEEVDYLKDFCAEEMWSKSSGDPDITSERDCYRIVDSWSDEQCVEYLGADYILGRLQEGEEESEQHYSIRNAATGQYLVGYPYDYYTDEEGW